MQTVTQRIQIAYNQIAPVYEQRNSEHMPPRLELLARTIVRHTKPHARIIDVGCGTGRDMAWFENHQMIMTGVDLSPGMLTFARQRVSGRLVQADMHTLPFRSARFDGAWCCASLLHIPKRELPAVLYEVQRVVRPGGLVMIAVQAGDGEQWDDGYIEGVTRFFARYQQDELRAVLEACGLQIIDQGYEEGSHRNWLTMLCQTAHFAKPHHDKTHR